MTLRAVVSRVPELRLRESARLRGVSKYACARCGKKNTAARMVFSRFTGNRYCAYETGACEKRAKRGRKRLA
jgi:hypothetical protein